MKKILQIILLAFIATFADTSAQRLSPPNWTVNPALYQYSANVTSKIMVNNLPAPSGNNMLAAFVGNEIRGVATPLQFGNDFIYFLTVYTNNPADTVTLKAYIAQTDRILNIVERQAIVPNGVYGTVTSPVIFNAYDLNNNPPRLSGIPDQTIETGQQFAQFDLDNYLTELDGDQVTYSYSGNNNLTVSINSTTHVVTVTPNPSGWIGIDTMYFRVTDVNAAALFSEDTVVFRVRPVDNPPQISPIPNQKIGTNNSFSPVNLNNYVTTLDDDSIALSYEVDLTGSNDPWPNWSVNPSSFSQSMSLTAEVNAFGKPSSASQRWIAAYSGNEVRGYGRAVQFGSKYLYFLTIYANAPGDTITFKYYDSTAKKMANVEQKIIFVNNSSVGTPSNPYLLNAGNIIVAIDSRGIARFTVPNKTWTGTERIRFRVSDIGTVNNYFDTTTVSLTVFSDGAPVVSGIPDQTVQKGTPFTPFDLDDYLTEPDGQNVVWSYSGNSNLNVSINAQNIVTVTPVNPAWVGSESIIFRVTDVSPNALSTADTVVFRITPLDNAPVIGGIPDQVSQPNGLFPGVNLRDYVTELDGDSVSYSYTIDTPQPPDPSPSWSINTSAFEQTMTMTIEMSSLEVRPSGTAHKLAAFAGNEIRGVVSPILFNGKWLYFMTVYANAARENIRFKFYDATANKLLPVKQSVTFVPNGSFGSPTNPFQLDAGNIIFGLNGNILNAQVTDSSWSGEQYITVTARDALTPFQLSDTTRIKFRVPVPVNLPIAAPANLTGTAQINPNRIVLSWTDMSNNETGFVIQRKSGDSASANPYVILDTVGANIATFTDTDLLESFKYTYRVYGINQFVVSPFSNAFTITSPGNLPVPAAPVLASPANGATGQPLALNLVWNKSAGAATYRVQLSTVNTFATTIVNDSTITDSVRAISGLSNNTTYYWRVNAKNATGTSIYSTVFSFTTQPAVPAAPVLASPANGAVNQPLALNLIWNKSAGAATYRIQVSTVNTFATTIINDSTVTDSLKPVTGLLNNTTYYWRVNAKNAGGTSTYSTVYSFTTQPAVPTAPVLASPSNGAVNQPTALNLVWNKSAGAVTYRVQLSTVNTFATTIINDSTLTDSVKAVSGLQLNTTYYWRVNAKNANGTGSYSTVYSFTTLPAVPAAPVLASPANGASGQPLALNLVWNKSAGAASYRVQLSTVNTFATTIVNDSTITDSVKAISGLLNNTTYYWRVNAKNATGTSTYSTVYSFTTQPAVPAAPVLASPANGAVNQPLALNLVWNKSAGAATYRVQLSTTNTFATTIVNDSTITDSVRAISGLLNNTTYYWRVNAKNATGTSTYSTVFSFTTLPAVPVAPVLASPANGAT
ncbi:MAG: fibronectin type III domain-containing protein, partial [Ignavibacteriaceae bacterium]|nr:fibronectin type III domain-containing protein [Ignavibacteriaceae bacterium]